MMRILRKKTVSLAASICILIFSAIWFNACEAPDPTGPAASNRITLTTTRDSLPADGSSTCTITAYVLNRNGVPATDSPIYWSTTCGSLSVATGTIAGGYASVTFTASNYGCKAVITADAVHAKKSIEIIVDSYGVDIDANPSSIPADGSSTSTMSAYVFDSLGNPVSDGTVVNFSTTAGTLSTASASTSGGWAYATLTSGTVAGTAAVTARVEASTATAYVNFTNTVVDKIILSALPSSGIPADGASYSLLRATVSVNGHPAPFGTVITFTSTWGTVENYQATTDVTGVAQTRLISSYSTSSKSATVQAFAGTVQSAPVNVYFNGYTGTPVPSPTPQPTYTNTPTPVQTNTPTMTPTYTPTPTNTPVPSATPTP